MDLKIGKLGFIDLDVILGYIILGIIILLLFFFVLRYLFILFFHRKTILYQSNGRIHIEGYTLFNRRIDDFKVFDEEGNLINRWHYENGEKTRDEFINPNNGKVWKVIKNTYPKIVIHLDNVDRAYLSDKELVKQAVVTNPSNIKYVFSIHDIDVNTMTNVLRRDGLLLEFLGEERKKDYYIVSVAISENGLALQFADKSLKKNKDIALKAVQQNGLALRFADTTMQMDREIIYTAVEQNGYSLLYAIPTMLEAKSLLKLTIKQIETQPRYIFNNPLKWENWFIFFVWANYNKLIREVEFSTPEKKMMEYIDKRFPEKRLLKFNFGQSIYQSQFDNDNLWFFIRYYRTLTKMKRLIIKYLND